MEMSEVFKGHIAILVAGPDESSLDSVQFFYYMARSALHAMIAAADNEQKPQMQQLARENLETVQAWLNERLQS